jgi:sialate O-acetylesterase
MMNKTWQTVWRSTRAVLCVTIAAIAGAAQANVDPAPIFGNGMCLQREKAVPVWGHADRNESITVTIAGATATARSDADGQWRVVLPPLKAGGPYELEMVARRGAKKFTDVYVGDVWLCAGQSNMQLEIYRTTTAAEAARESKPQVRICKVGGRWAAAEGAALQNFSAIGYYFGRSLNQDLKIPIGLIYCGEGGTSAEVWTPLERLQALHYSPLHQWNAFYTQRILPLRDFAIKGCLWYQGESNTSHPGAYPKLMAALIGGWRDQFQQGDFPFLIVQLARSSGPAKPPRPEPAKNWPRLRDAQLKILGVKNTGLVCCFDVTNGNIHPPMKQPVGERLESLARSMAYGEPESVAPRCPLLERAEHQGQRIILHFSQALTGLMLQNGTIAPDGSVLLAPAEQINDLFLVRRDGSYVPAQAKLDGSSVVIDIRGETALPDIYYAWDDFPLGNIYNKSGLPLSPFRVTSLTVNPESVDDRTIVLRTNHPLTDPKAVSRPGAILVNGARVEAVVVDPDAARLKITTDRHFAEGDKVTIDTPGIKAWDSATPLPAFSFTVLPGRLAAGGLMTDLLIGGLRGGFADIEKSYDDPSLDIAKLRPAPGPDWKRVEALDGHFDLLKVAGDVPQAFLYATTKVYSTADRTVQIWFSCDNGFKLNVNGTTISQYPHAFIGEADSVQAGKVSLKKGWNTVTFQLGHRRGDWDLWARIVNENGGPAEGVSYAAVIPNGK